MKIWYAFVIQLCLITDFVINYVSIRDFILFIIDFFYLMHFIVERENFVED